MPKNLKMATLKAGIALAAAFGTVGVAQAACNATVSSISPVNVVFNPFDGVMAFDTLRVTVVNGGSDACSLAIAIKSDATGSTRYLQNGPNNLQYVIKTDADVQLANDLNMPAGMIELPGGANSTASFNLRLEVSAGQVSGAGQYSDNLTLRLFDLAGPATPFGIDRTWTVHTVVPARAQINLAGGDAAFGAFSLDRLDFGELQEGSTRDAAVQVRSTAPVTVTVLSQNTGVLRHKVLGTSVPTVPYSLSLAGTVANLVAGPLSIDRTPPLTLSGESYPLRVIVGTVAGRVAGDYQDILTISVVPR